MKNKCGEENNVHLFNSNPLNFYFLKDLTKDSFCKFWYDNTFSLFKSYNDIFYIIYTNYSKSIISLNLISNQIINEIKNAHKEDISNFRHYLDKANKRDLLISLSQSDNNLKLWNINNYECLVNIEKVNEIGCLSSACFLNMNNIIYIISSNSNKYNNNIEFIKIFDLNGNKVKEIDNSDFSTCFIDTYYDKNVAKNFIITGNRGFSQSYDYNGNKIYFKYCDDNKETTYHMSIIIDDTDKIIKMIESSCAGIIRIWDFHTADLLNKIQINKEWLYSICLWNKDYLFVGCFDKNIKLIELKTKKIIMDFEGHTEKVLTIKKIIHPKYGECLISQNANKSHIKLWVNCK